MKFEKIEITNHAISRFAERSLEFGLKKPYDVYEQLLSLLKTAQKSKTNRDRKRRQFWENTKIYISRGWKLIVENNCLITVFRISNCRNLSEDLFAI